MRRERARSTITTTIVADLTTQLHLPVHYPQTCRVCMRKSVSKINPQSIHRHCPTSREDNSDCKFFCNQLFLGPSDNDTFPSHKAPRNVSLSDGQEKSSSSSAPGLLPPEEEEAFRQKSASKNADEDVLSSDDGEGKLPLLKGVRAEPVGRAEERGESSPDVGVAGAVSTLEPRRGPSGPQTEQTSDGAKQEKPRIGVPSAHRMAELSRSRTFDAVSASSSSSESSPTLGTSASSFGNAGATAFGRSGNNANVSLQRPKSDSNLHRMLPLPRNRSVDNPLRDDLNNPNAPSAMAWKSAMRSRSRDRLSYEGASKRSGDFETCARAFGGAFVPRPVPQLPWYLS